MARSLLLCTAAVPGSFLLPQILFLYVCFLLNFSLIKFLLFAACCTVIRTYTRGQFWVKNRINLCCKMLAFAHTPTKKGTEKTQLLSFLSISLLVDDFASLEAAQCRYFLFFFNYYVKSND